MATVTASMAVRRAQAKTGMVVALGVLVGTGFLAHGRTARLAHVAAGVCLVGCAYWHWSLYQDNGKHQGSR